MSPRSTFYLLTNIDEHPEALPLANKTITEKIDKTSEHIGQSSERESILQSPESLPKLIAMLDKNRSAHVMPWHDLNGEINPSSVKHSLTQYAPTALLIGCWLQSVLRVAMAASPTGARLARMYKHQLQIFHSGNNFVSEYQELHRRLAFTLPDVSSRSFADNSLFEESSFELPLFLLGIGQFPRMYLPELLGVHLGLQYLGVNTVGPMLIQEAPLTHSLAKSKIPASYVDQIEMGCELALDTVVKALAEQSNTEKDAFWSRICVGAWVVDAIWQEWLSCTGNWNATGIAATREDMIAILCQKRPYAFGYHGDKRIGDERIDSLFASENFKPAEMLDRLAVSRFIVPGKPEESLFCTSLVGWGGPMHSIFSPTELTTINAWIQTLPTSDEHNAVHPLVNNHVNSHWQLNRGTEHIMCARSDFLRRSQTVFSRCSIREMFHYLVNIEHYPEVLPCAEQFARNRLDRSMAALNSHIRPIPSRHYSPEILELWVNKTHREQVDTYQALKGEPTVSKDVFIDDTVQLAPLILIDGAWLQGMLTQNIIHSETGRILFQILYEETGEGDSTRHHANIYRELLHAMGVQPPAIETKEFTQWAPLLDSSFDIPVFWLSISSFPRHFMPEILGLNLAVELAGVGGPYMQARDTLRHFKLPTLFVDVHLAADNISQGHTAKSLIAIKTYMEHIATREGPHNLDSVWRRIWSGVRSTLPQIGIARLFAHKVGARLRGNNVDQAARIFVD